MFVYLFMFLFPEEDLKFWKDTNMIMCECFKSISYN